jgi:hypothetical protein
MEEQRRRNRVNQQRWYYRNGGIPQTDHRRAIVRAAVARYDAKKRAEKAREGTPYAVSMKAGASGD